MEQTKLGKMWWKYFSRLNCWEYDNAWYITWKSLYRFPKIKVQKIIAEDKITKENKTKEKLTRENYTKDL